MAEVPDNVDDALDALDDPTTDEVLESTLVRDFSARELAAAALTRGGGVDPSALRRGTFSAEDFVEIANNGLAPLGWADNESEGGPVLDLTNPLQPAVIVAGVYTVTAWVSVTAMTDGGYFEVTLDLDFSGEGASNISAMSRPATTGDPSAPFCLVSGTYYIPAGGTIRLLARSRDGASAQDFAIESASVQQVA